MKASLLRDKLIKAIEENGDHEIHTGNFFDSDLLLEIIQAGLKESEVFVHFYELKDNLKFYCLSFKKEGLFDGWVSMDLKNLPPVDYKL